MELRYAIGGALRELRLERQLTLREVSSKSYMAISHLSEVERGLAMSSPETLEAIAHGLSLTTVELMGEIYEYLRTHNETTN
jgi:transcriptional regulator with XRE-family HTH domain